MSNLNKRPVRRAAVGVLAGTLAFSGGALVAVSPANAVEGFAFDQRIGGNDRYDTAALAALDAFPGGATTAVLATGQDFPDALAANYLAGALNAPILLTTPGTLSDAAADALDELGVTDVVIVGGTTAVSTAVQAELTALGYTVERRGGTDRYATGALVAEAGVDEEPVIGELNGLTTAILGSGQNFADILAAGPIAYARSHPLLITRPGALPSQTRAFLETNDIEQVVVLGGTTAVSDAVETEVETVTGAPVVRLAGVDRWDTARLVAEASYESFGFDRTTADLARGDQAGGGADALAGGPNSALRESPILLTIPNDLPVATAEFFEDNSDTLESGTIYGGLQAVNQAVEDEAEELAQGDVVTPPAAPFETLAVTPDTAQTLVLADETVTATANSDNRTYTVTGLNDALRYRVTLVNGASIQGDETNRTFLSSVITPATATTPATFGVDVGADNADITSVNGGVPLNGGAALDAAARTATANPVNGNLTFVIDGTGPGTVVPAVYVDGGQGGTATTGGASNRLETTATAAGQFAPASETYGLGGPTVYTAPAQANGGFTGTVTNVDKAADSIVIGTGGAARTLSYDANDLFEVNNVSVGLAAFEAALTSGDAVAGTFTNDPAGVSSFDLTDDNPGVSGTPVASVDGDDVTVTGSFANTGGLDQVVVQRATVTNGTAGAFSTIATVTATDTDNDSTNGTQVSYVDMNVAVGTYQYRLAGINDGQTGAFSAVSNNAVVAPASADVAAPLAIDTISTTNAGLAGDLGAGDVFKVVFNEDIAAPSASTTFRLLDGNGTQADLVNGANATFTRNAAAETVNGVSRAANRVLTVTLTGAPSIVVAGTVIGVQLPADITAAGGITDVAGNVFTPATGGQDVTVEAVGTDTQNNAADTAPATVAATNPAVGATSVIFTANEALTAGSLAVTDFAGTAAAKITGVSLSATGTVITVTTTALALGETVILQDLTVTDLAGNLSPVADQTATTTDQVAPTANNAVFTDLAGGVASIFGDEVGDAIVITYSETVRFDGVPTVTVGGVTYTEDSNLDITVTGANVTLTVANAAAADLTVVDGTTAVTASTGIEDLADNAAVGYPEVLND